jgi:cellulose synthase/poly-beta-1,6-N-acetylglucosamine synthase-like glycosyltransferase
VRFVCIIDADALLSEGSLALARRGLAEGHDVLQSSYVFGEGLGVRAEVMRIASAAIIARGLGRASLGLSDTLKGNGMFFRREVLQETPWCAYSLAEDLEYTMLLLAKGKRVRVMDGSTVSGKLSATKKGETDQRLRWEGGRLDLVRKEVPVLLRRLFTLQTLDMLIELLIPPLGLLVGLQALALIVTALLPGDAHLVLVGAWVLLGGYVVLSVPLAGLPLKTFLALAYVPVYVLWKIALLPRTWIASRSKRWIRTAR